LSREAAGASAALERDNDNAESSVSSGDHCPQSLLQTTNSPENKVLEIIELFKKISKIA
jgi:hypothetical protein